jgi:hypothetical protein
MCSDLRGTQPSVWVFKEWSMPYRASNGWLC